MKWRPSGPGYDVDTIMALIVMVISLAVTIRAVRLAKCHGLLGWTRAGAVLMGLLNMAIYAYVVGVRFSLWPQIDPVYFGRTFSRPVNLGTLALLLVTLSLLGPTYRRCKYG